MHALKDKVSNQLSRFFPDSPNSNLSSSPSPASDNSLATPFSKGGKSLSSYFSFHVPSLNFGGSGSNKQQQDFKSIQSKPDRWGGKGFKQQDDYTAKYQECSIINENEDFCKSSEDCKGSGTVGMNKQTGKTHDCNEDGGSASSSSDNDVFEDVRSFLPDLMEESSLISLELYEFLNSCLPNIVKGCQWALLYSTLKHGISLRTLIRKSADLSGPCVLIIADKQGTVFGGLLECPLKPTPKRKYQGTNQCFVFTTIYGEPRLFRPTGANRYFYMCLNDLLALGGGGNFALCLDGDLLNGTSGPCETFGNMCLAHKPEFEIKNVELWGFTHSSKYLA